MIKNALNLFRRLKKGSQPIQWQPTDKLYDPRKPYVSWKIIDKKLFLDGREHTPLYPISKANLEKAILNLKQQIGSRPIEIEAIYIEPHVATGLWNEGALTIEHLKNAHGKYRGTTFSMEFLGEVYIVSIQSGTYYDSYEFLVQGLPGVRRVRDVPDALSLFAGQLSTF